MSHFKQKITQVQNTLQPYWRTVTKSGSLHLMSANLFNQALGFISSLFVVRFLRPEELGQMRVISTYGSYVQLLGGLGLTVAVLTYVPRTQDAAVRRRWLFTTLQVTGAATAVFSMIAVWLSWRGLLMTDANTAFWFRWSLVSGFATVFTSVMIAYYQAERAVKKLAGIQSVVRLVTVLICVGGAWLGGFKGYVIASIICPFVMLGSLLGWNRPDKVAVPHLPLPAGFLSAAGLALLANLLWTAGRTADVVILDRVVTDRARFGCYTFALTIATILSLVNSTVQVVTVPFFAARHEAADWVLRNARKWQLAGVVLTVAVAVVLEVGVTFLIVPIYGHAYAGAAYFLAPLMIAQCLLATFHILSAALAGMGMISVNTTVGFIVVPVSVGISYYMATRYGLDGAVWGQVLSAAIYALVQSGWGWLALSRRAKLLAAT